MSIRIVNREDGLSAEFVCDWCEEQIEDAGLGMVTFVKPTWESYFLQRVSVKVTHIASCNMSGFDERLL